MHRLTFGLLIAEAGGGDVVDALISSRIDHVAFAADEAYVHHVLQCQAQVSSGHAIAKLGKVLRAKDDDMDRDETETQTYKKHRRGICPQLYFQCIIAQWVE